VPRWWWYTFLFTSSENSSPLDIDSLLVWSWVNVYRIWGVMNLYSPKGCFPFLMYLSMSIHLEWLWAFSQVLNMYALIRSWLTPSGYVNLLLTSSHTKVLRWARTPFQCLYVMLTFSLTTAPHVLLNLPSWLQGLSLSFDLVYRKHLYAQHVPTMLAPSILILLRRRCHRRSQRGGSEIFPFLLVEFQMKRHQQYLSRTRTHIIY
jgi:hypothetical protein